MSTQCTRSGCATCTVATIEVGSHEPQNIMLPATSMLVNNPLPSMDGVAVVVVGSAVSVVVLKRIIVSGGCGVPEAVGVPFA